MTNSQGFSIMNGERINAPYDQDKDFEVVTTPSSRPNFQLIQGERDERDEVRAVLSAGYLDDDEAFFDDEDRPTEFIDELEPTENRVTTSQKVAIGGLSLVVLYFITNRFQYPAENIDGIWDYLTSKF